VELLAFRTKLLDLPTLHERIKFVYQSNWLTDGHREKIRPIFMGEADFLRLLDDELILPSIPILERVAFLLDTDLTYFFIDLMWEPPIRPIGRRLRQLRIARGLSQEHVSAQMWCTSIAIHLMEEDEYLPGRRTLEQFGQVFGMTIKEMTGPRYALDRPVMYVTDTLSRALYSVEDEIIGSIEDQKVQGGVDVELSWRLVMLSAKKIGRSHTVTFPADRL
jgi:transcriptional regulator with XRE-family HTH domain